MAKPPNHAAYIGVCTKCKCKRRYFIPDGRHKSIIRQCPLCEINFFLYSDKPHDKINSPTKNKNQ